MISRIAISAAAGFIAGVVTQNHRTWKKQDNERIDYEVMNLRTELLHWLVMAPSRGKTPDEINRYAARKLDMIDSLLSRK